MPSISRSVQPLLERGTAILSNVPGPAGALAKRLGGGPPARPEPASTDEALGWKVESALYRLPGVARSKVQVTVAGGTATVRGVARDRAQMARIETAVRGVPGVEGYESRLELPKAAPKGRTAPAKGARPAKGKAKRKAAS